MDRRFFMDVYWTSLSFLLIVPFNSSQGSHTYSHYNHDYYYHHSDTKYNDAVAGIVVGSFIGAIIITVIIVICIKKHNKTYASRSQVIHPHLQTISTSIRYNQSFTTTFQEPPPYQQFADPCPLPPPYPENSGLFSSATLFDTDQPPPKYQQ